MRHNLFKIILPFAIALSVNSCMNPAELERAMNEANYNPSSYSPGRNYDRANQTAYNKGYNMGRLDARMNKTNDYQRYHHQFNGNEANQFKHGYEVAYRNYMPHYGSNYQANNYSQSYSHKDYLARNTQGTGSYQAQITQGGIRITQGGRQISFIRTASPNIEKHHFIYNKSQIVVKSRGNHGPATVELFDTRTGTLKGKVLAYAIKHGQPAWARGMQD